MKIKRTKHLLYIFSTVMVLGLALISFDAPKPVDKQTDILTPTRSPNHTATPSSVPTQAPNHTTTPTVHPTAMATATPTPSPTPSLAQQNATIPIQPATDDVGNGITTVIKDYLNNYYSKKELQVEEITNITCYYKKGLGDIDYFAYVTYDISYEGSNVLIPALDEYLIRIEGEEVSVLTESQNAEVMEALLLSRASGSVCELHIKELIRRYMHAKLAVDESLLFSMVTDSSYLDLESIRRTTEYIEEYKNLQYLIYKCPEEIKEFDYLVFLSNDLKIVNISTLAPGVDEFLITLDENNYPRIFRGITSESSDNYRSSIRMQSEYQAFLENNVVKPLAEAMTSDPDLLEFINRIKDATESAQ